MDQKDKEKQKKKKFLGIYFKCCNVYSRIYKNKAGTAYEGVCPGCGRHAFVAIGEHGTRSRFFIAE
jgi:hypothetical protein